jgi:hypothetical protein
VLEAFAAAPIQAVEGEHGLIMQLFQTRFTDLYWWFAMIVTLLFAGFAFTAGSYIYAYVISQRVEILAKNHIEHLQRAVRRLNKRAGFENDGVGENDEGR